MRDYALSVNDRSAATGIEAERPVDAAAVLGGVALVGAVGMCLAGFLEWGNDIVFQRSVTAKGVPLQLLWDTSPTGRTVALLWPALLCGLVAVAGALKAGLVRWAIGAGAVGALLCFLYVNAITTQLSDGFDDFGSASLSKAVGVGAWIYGASAVVVLVASIVRLRLTTPHPSRT